MGCFNSKTTESFDVIENPLMEQMSIYELTHYTDITKEELDNIKRITAFKNARIYENLVFEGGGIKGMAYCGSVKRIEELGILHKIKRFAGSSAGAIAAAVLAVGYTADELTEIMHTDFDKFMGDKYNIIGAINFHKHLGCTSGDEFEKFIGDLIYAKTGNSNFTFVDLYNEGIELVVTVTNLNRSLPMYFSNHNHPHLPIKEAVRMSMSIPILFFPHKHNKDYYVDGGMLDNYPLHVFDGEYPGDPQAVLNKAQPNPFTLGLKLMSNNEEHDLEVTKRVDIATEKEFLCQLISTLYIQSERRNMVPSFWKRTVVINVPNIPITTFSLTDDERNELYTCGYNAVDDFYDN